MDREPEEMQFLGLFGIYLESYKIVISWRKIFSRITLSLILPLSFIILARLEVYSLLFSEIRHNKHELYKSLSPKEYNKIVDHISFEWITLRLFKFFYLTFSLVFSLLSTSAVVYTIAYVYTSREVTFKKVMSVVPNVWKRLLVTFMCTFIIFSLYNIFGIIVFVIWVFTIGETDAGGISLIVVFILYLVGLAYLGSVWHLASVLSVLEESYGFKAMMKSKALMKGKTFISMVIFLKSLISIVAILLIFEIFVVRGGSSSIVSRVALGFLCLLSLCKLLLFALVVHTVIYFVCKSYHHENIDKSILSDHLDVYLGEYVPLKAKDIQLEQVQFQLE